MLTKNSENVLTDAKKKEILQMTTSQAKEFNPKSLSNGK
jgi:hypothetical protein